MVPAPAEDGLEMIEDAASALRRAGIGVSDLGLRRPTLDDVFLQLTGAPPSENGAGPATNGGPPARGRRPRPRCRPSGSAPAPARAVVAAAARLRQRRRQSSPGATCATSSASRSC